MNKKLNPVFIIIFLVLISSSGCAYYSRGPWMGRVIDSETKQPIEGAVVVAEWHESYAALPESTGRLKDVKEVATNSDGIFKIDAQSYFSILPDSTISGPAITIFKAGYGYFPIYQTYPKITKDWEKGYFEKPGAIVELPKFKTIEERRKNLNGGELWVLANVYNHNKLKKLKKLLEQMNIERVEEGYEPFETEW